MKSAELLNVVGGMPSQTRDSVARELALMEIQLLRNFSGAAVVTDRRFYDGQAFMLRELVKLFRTSAHVANDVAHVQMDTPE